MPSSLNLTFAYWLFVPFIAARQCTNIMIPVSINARQAMFNQAPITDNFLSTQFALELTSSTNGGNYTANVVTGYQTVTGNYNIGGTFCRPDAGIGSNATVQLLIHGIGFDRSYWDLPIYNNANSYVASAVDKYSFCTLAIDRFGIGASFIPGLDPINLVQAPAAVSTILSITNQLRNGTVPGVPNRFQKVVHVGHSFGSFLSYLLVTEYPTASDGLILTGSAFSGAYFFRTIAGFNLHLASLNQPLRFGNVQIPRLARLLPGPTDIVAYILNNIRLTFPGISLTYDTVYQDVATTEVLDITNGYNTTSLPPQNLPPSYLTWSDITANIYAFLYPPTITADAALYSEKTKQPVTVGELLTIGNAPPTASRYTGPVLIITGRQDNIYCGGDCTVPAAPGTNSNVIQAGAAAFPSASKFEAYIQPDTGHAMNFHFNATGYYEVVQQFLGSQGLGGITTPAAGPTQGGPGAGPPGPLASGPKPASPPASGPGPQIQKHQKHR